MKSRGFALSRSHAKTDGSKKFQSLTGLMREPRRGRVWSKPFAARILAASRAAPLNEASKRCLRWRDAMAEVLRECSAQLDGPPQALLEGMILTLEGVTLIG